MFMCRQRGAYASAQCKQLKKECTSTWGGRRHGNNRFMDGKHPCLPKVIIEGQRCTNELDFSSGASSCARHEAVWAKVSKGGLTRSVPSVGRSAPVVPPPACPVPGEPCARGVRDPPIAGLPGEVGSSWDDGLEVADEVCEEEPDAWEAAEFFGLV